MTDVTELTEHWYWRPGWRVGRSFYTWHITFAKAPAVGLIEPDARPAVRTAVRQLG